MQYYGNVKRTGAETHGKLPSTIGVSLEPDGQIVGVALAAGEDKTGSRLWRPAVGKDELPGRFVLVDGLFTPAEGDAL